MSQPLSKNYKWYVVGMLWWIAFFNYADRQAVFSVFPLLSKEFHLSNFQLGLLGSSFAWVYGLCAPFAGNIVDRIRRKTAILAGLQFWSIVCMATAISRTFGNLLFFRAAEGLGETVYFPASMSLISDYHGKTTRSRAMGTHQTSVYVGIIAGGYFAGLIGQHYGWRSSFIVFGGCGVLLGLVLNRFLKEPARGAADLEEVAGHALPPVKPPRMKMADFLKVIWGTPTVLLLMAAFMCENFTAMVLFTWMPTYLYQNFHMSLAVAGLTATIYIQLMSMVGSPLAGWLADILRRRTPGGRILVQAIGIFAEAPFAAWCALTGSTEWLIVSLLFWGFFKSFYEANIFASVFDVIRPEARGTATGFMNMMGWLAGGGTAPVVVGYLSDRIGLSHAMALTSLSYVVASVLLITAVLKFVRRDNARMQAVLAAEAAAAA
ncbi:MAG: MFS transporter [Bryobacteraceae bacterium]